MHEIAACLACLNPHVGLPGGDERQVDLRRPGSHFSRVTRRTGVERMPPSTCFSNAKLLQSHSSSILQSLNFFEVKRYFAFQFSLKIKVQVSWWEWTPTGPSASLWAGSLAGADLGFFLQVKPASWSLCLLRLDAFCLFCIHVLNAFINMKTTEK
jgi:hypothetical protein